MTDICQRCDSERIMTYSGKTGDRNIITIGDRDHNGYVPSDLNIGDDDYVDFDVCLDCGQMQGTYPLPLSGLERADDEED